MTDLNNFIYTDGMHDVLAVYVNRLLAATLRSEYKNIETLTANRTLSDADTPIQRLDGDGSSWDVMMPTPDAVENHVFLVVNASSGAEVLTLKSNDEVTTLKALAPGGVAFLLPDGDGGYLEASGITDHGALSGLSDDDHAQYLLATGLREWSEQASDPSTPGANKWKLYFKSGGLYFVDDAGTVIGPLGGGSDFLAVLSSAEISITGTNTATLGRMHVCSGSGNYTVTLPAASGNAGKFLGFRFTNTGITTLDGNAAETIDTVTTRPYYQGWTVVLMCDGLNWHTINGVTAGKTQMFFPAQFDTNAGVTHYIDTGQRLNYYAYSTTVNNGDWIEVGLWLSAGTYTCELVGYTGSAGAKLDWTLNGVSQTTAQDWYSASPTKNVVKTFTLTVPFTGYHVLKGTVNGKNASSSGYAWYLSCGSIYPAAY